jgi:hypothetical protein
VAVRNVSPDRKSNSTGGCQSSLADKLGVSPSQYHNPWSTLQITGDEQKARTGRSSETSVSSHHSQSTIYASVTEAVPTIWWHTLKPKTVTIYPYQIMSPDVLQRYTICPLPQLNSL